MPNDDRHGVKKSKDRVTLLLACRKGRDKVEPPVVDKAENFRALKGANRNKMAAQYTVQSSAWMHGDLFEDWLKNFDTDVGR